MHLYVSGVSLIGPGLPGWAESLPVLRGEAPHAPAPLVLPPPALLAPTERRRTSQAVRLALAAAAAAAEDGAAEACALDTVFASSNGDGAVVGAILDALADPGGAISPTQFHNSVHNAAAGYWGIAVHSDRPSVSLGGHDDTFAAGLLQAAASAAANGHPVLYCAYDAPLAPPLAAKRPTEDPFATALLLTPEPTPRSRARVALRYRDEVAEAPPPPSPLAATLAPRNAIARALPLLEALARGGAARLVFPLADGTALEAEIVPC